MSDTQPSDVRGLQQRAASIAGHIVQQRAERVADLQPAADVRCPEVADDSLLAAVMALARHYRMSPVAGRILSGLPLEQGRLEAKHLVEAAGRAGLRLRRFPGHIKTLQHHHLPALGVEDNGNTLLILAVDDGGVLVQSPSQSLGPSTDTSAAGRRVPVTDLVRDGIRLYLVAPRGIESESTPADMVRHTTIAGNQSLYMQAIIATIVVNLIALALPLYTMNVYDRVLPNGAVATLIALSIGAAIAGLFDVTLRTLRQVLLDTASRRADMTLAMRVFGRVLGAKVAPRSSSVGVQASTLREFETLREFYASMTLTAFGDIPFAILFIAVIGYVGGYLAIVPIVAFPLVLLAVLATQRPLARLNEQAFKGAANKNAVLVETLTGMETVKGLGAESWAASRWERSFAEHLRLSNAMRFYSTLGLNIVALAQTIATIAMIVLGAFLVSNGQITAGALMAAMMLLSRALSPLSQIAGLASRLHQARTAQVALQQMVEAAQEREDGAELIALPRLQGNIEFESVRFAYDQDRGAILDGVGLSIKGCERIGVIGVIGSGKSTLLKLITKLHEPGEGRVLLDGVGLSAIDPAWLRIHTGYLGQEAVLFQGSIRENLTIHRPYVSDADLLFAADAAGALDWIGRLPKGLDTRLGERGAGLSGGQKRSLALARALVGRPKLLLLDEPTSEMDSRTEARVIEKLKADLAGRTLIVVTHRPAMLELVDRLVVINSGKIVADGPKAIVLDQLKQQAAEQTRKPGAAAGVAMPVSIGRQGVRQ